MMVLEIKECLLFWVIVTFDRLKNCTIYCSEKAGDIALPLVEYKDFR